MDQNSTSTLFDADHDIPRRAVAPLSGDAVRASQRLVVNPVLAILTALLSVSLVHHALRTLNVLLFIAALGLLGCATVLFQFHCLDCGKVGWYLHSGRHVCPAVVLRCTDQHHQKAGLRHRTQYLIWIYALGIGLLGYALFSVLRL